MSHTEETTLHVLGMTCSSCVRHVRGALQELEGIGAVAVDLDRGEVVVARDPARASESALVAALAEAGYAARVKGDEIDRGP